MRKKLKMLICIICLLFACTLAGCGDSLPQKPDDLQVEFWIGDNVDNYDFSGYDMETGWFGCDVYYGLDYKLTGNDEGEMVEPIAYVKYTVSAYPDYSSSNSAITAIKITDSNIGFYGLTKDASEQEFEEILAPMGYEIESLVNIIVATMDKTTIALGKTEINGIITSYLAISIEVTNKTGIMF